MGGKRHVSLTIDAETFEKARALGINVSKACENYLKQLIEAIEGVNRQKGGNLGTVGSGAGPLGFEPRTFSLEGAWVGTAEDWNRFREWIEAKKFAARYATTLYNYAQRFSECLFNRDLSRIRDLSDSMRPNVLKALSALAKFTGQYEDWKVLLKQYGLGWVGRNTDDVIIDRLTRTVDPNEVWDWIRLVKQERPQLSGFMELLAVSGLRFIEAVNSYNLIQQLYVERKLDTYYVHDKFALEHFRFKEIFLRSSKKAFVSFVPQEIIKSICVSEKLPSADAVQKLVQKRGLPLRFADIREAHGTFMVKYLRREEIDFLHGRVTSGVFMQHYFNPALIGDLRERVFQGIREILEKI